MKIESVSHSVMSNSLQPHGLQPPRLFCPWNSPGKNTGVGSHSLLQGIFLTQRSNPGFLHCRQIPYHLSYHSSILKNKQNHAMYRIESQNIRYSSFPSIDLHYSQRIKETQKILWIHRVSFLEFSLVLSSLLRVILRIKPDHVFNGDIKFSLR